MIDMLGITGAALILIAFVLNQQRILDDDDIGYDLCNLAGGTLLIFSAYHLHSLPFLLLNGVWTLVSLKDVLVDLGYISAGKTKVYPKKRRKKNG